MRRRLGGFGAVQLVPRVLVGPVRAILAGQGLPTSVVDDSGNADGMGLLSALFDTVEVHTRLSNPVKIKLSGGPSDPATEALIKEIQPALVFTGRAGQFQIAPYGVPNTIMGAITRAGPLLGIGIGASLLGLLFIGGAIGRRTAPKRLAGYNRR
jgi:hypothetical protein